MTSPAPRLPRTPRRKATALRYRAPMDRAPRLVAKGQGFVADQIVATARRHGVPIREDPFLVEALATLDLDAQIPPELYRVVAELLVFVYRLNEEWKRRFDRAVARRRAPVAPAPGAQAAG